MSDAPQSSARRLLQEEWAQLTAPERQLAQRLLKRLKPRDVNRELHDQRTLGERAADRIAAFGGSWTFIILFFVVLVSWTMLNTELLGPRKVAFDPYPYVFLNLILSMLAAIQAPIIMMSQNRQGARDRLEASNDYEVNVRAELAIAALHQKLDSVRDEVLLALLEEARQQTVLLERLAGDTPS
jgi:uncharacterized membrane protein